MSKKYLLVCEGPTDIIVIKKIAKKISEVINSEIIIQELSPRRDATTKRYPEHGWEEVKQWCKLYGKNSDNNDNPFAILARSKSWEAQLTISNADALIIQMDTDIVSYITDLATEYSGISKQSRKRFAKNAILSWLGEDTLPSNIYLLLSTQSTETWLLATHERTETIFSSLPDNFDFEDIENIIELLCNLNLTYICYDDNGRTKLSKNNYQSYSQRIVNNLQKVRNECEEAENFCSFLENNIQQSLAPNS